MRTTREIEKIKNQNTFLFSILFSVLISFLMCFILYQSLPHRVCHNEINTTKITYDGNWRGCKDYSFSSEILCEEGFEISNYKHINQKMICPSDNLIGEAILNGVRNSCIIKEINKVCEIV